MARIIVVIRDGAMQKVYSDNPNISVDLLDYDNMEACDLENPDQSEEHAEYCNLESIFENDETFVVVW